MPCRLALWTTKKFRNCWLIQTHIKVAMMKQFCQMACQAKTARKSSWGLRIRAGRGKSKSGIRAGRIKNSGFEIQEHAFKPSSLGICNGMPLSVSDNHSLQQSRTQQDESGTQWQLYFLLIDFMTDSCAFDKSESYFIIFLKFLQLRLLPSIQNLNALGQ